MGVDAYILGTLDPTDTPNDEKVEGIFADRERVLEDAYSPHPVTHIGLVTVFRDGGEPVPHNPEDLVDFQPDWPLGRYYHPAYPSGDMPYYLILTRWMQAAIPTMAVWYGGDQERGFDRMSDAFMAGLAGHYFTYGHLEADAQAAELEDWYPAAWALTRTGSMCGRIHLERSELLETPEVPVAALAPALTSRDPFVRWRSVWAVLFDELEEPYAAHLAKGLWWIGATDSLEVSARRIVLLGARLLERGGEQAEVALEVLEDSGREAAKGQANAVREALDGTLEPTHLDPFRTGGRGMRRFGDDLAELLAREGRLEAG